MRQGTASIHTRSGVNTKVLRGFCHHSTAPRSPWGTWSLHLGAPLTHTAPLQSLASSPLFSALLTAVPLPLWNKQTKKLHFHLYNSLITLCLSCCQCLLYVVTTSFSTKRPTSQKPLCPGQTGNCSFSDCDFSRLPPRRAVSPVFANMANHLFFWIRNVW